MSASIKLTCSAEPDQAWTDATECTYVNTETCSATCLYIPLPWLPWVEKYQLCTLAWASRCIMRCITHKRSITITCVCTVHRSNDCNSTTLCHVQSACDWCSTATSGLLSSSGWGMEALRLWMTRGEEDPGVGLSQVGWRGIQSGMGEVWYQRLRPTWVGRKRVTDKTMLRTLELVYIVEHIKRAPKLWMGRQSQGAAVSNIVYRAIINTTVPTHQNDHTVSTDLLLQVRAYTVAGPTLPHLETRLLFAVSLLIYVLSLGCPLGSGAQCFQREPLEIGGPGRGQPSAGCP